MKHPFYPLLTLVFFLMFSVTQAQNMNGEKIQVAADALTVMKFNSEIKRYELGDRKGYTCQVRDADNSIVIKTLDDKPANTNLVVTEGKRTHYFIIVFLPKIDLNNTRLYYDYSDLKVVRKLAENAQPVAVNDTKTKEAVPEEKAAPKESNKEKKRREKEEAKAAEEASKQEEARKQALLAEQKKQQELIKQKEQEELARKEAAKKEQERIAAEKQQKEEKAKAQQEQERQERIARQEEKIKQEKEKQAQIAAAKEEARQRKAEEEAARIQKIQDDKTAALARQKEEQRLAAEKKKQEAEEKERKRIEAENQKKLALEQEKARKEQERLAKIEAEKKRKEEEERQKKEAEANKTSYTQAELWKKYPNIVFGDPPDGQHMAGEYYLPADTMENFRVSTKLMAIDTWLDKSSDTTNGVHITLQGIIFSGVNCYMRFKIVNKSKNDFLVGLVNLNWKKSNGSNTDLYPCYVNGYPVVLPGKEYTFIYASRAVNADEKDVFTFSLQDRLHKMKFQVPLTGAMYNLEMSR